MRRATVVLIALVLGVVASPALAATQERWERLTCQRAMKAVVYQLDYVVHPYRCVYRKPMVVSVVADAEVEDWFEPAIRFWYRVRLTKGGRCRISL